ncbi:tripartite tricarboxylate transporter substrate binding protein [Roseomonas terrae]|jgi:tripartite-type tricarboxylate transporter receptor subunit TctC|uniref:Tripartite tricarboxylate transporter substrate binding protein n=1 Tax=Neoroseomonas terrae TaxID=424799 RepID=A0ABS5EBD1_9PROT|nr:tripartite tricarboxylate transporter substrate binding protein [Neoroseomonas terrae]MBR0648326.1 tripartite tricarboxylate transporter substrate binding protein [Neoroseomonas terrae]
MTHQLRNADRRRLLQAAIGLPALALARPAMAQAWPNRPIRIIVPLAPGGSTDVMARILAERLGAALGQPTVVENRPGASGNIGMEQVARSAPDGYTLGVANVTQWAVNEYLYERMPYDTQRDLAYVSMNWELPNALTVPTAHVPATTARAFIDWAKAQPNGVAYGTGGVGSTSHLLSEFLGRQYGLTLTHVPYRGGSESLTALLRGDVQFTLDVLTNTLPSIQQGALRALAVTGSERSPLLPEVPTFAEAGLTGLSLTSWGGFVAPAGTPTAIQDRIAAALATIVAMPEVQSRFVALAARPISSTPAQMRERLDRERPTWAELVRASGARAG